MILQWFSLRHFWGVSFDDDSLLHPLRVASPFSCWTDVFFIYFRALFWVSFVFSHMFSTIEKKINKSEEQFLLPIEFSRKFQVILKWNERYYRRTLHQRAGPERCFSQYVLWVICSGCGSWSEWCDFFSVVPPLASLILLLLLLFTVLFGYRLLMLTPDVFSLISFLNHNWL